MSLDPRQVREEIVEPVLRVLDMYSATAVDLVMGTAAVESGFRYIKQLGQGPALGLWQMEPGTHGDIWDNYLAHREDIADRIRMTMLAGDPSHQQLPGNLFYACAMCRVHYYRVSAPLPRQGDINGLGQYWKDHYNTHLGAGTVQKFTDAYLKHCVER